MATRPFDELAGGDPSLLAQVERIVLDSHRGLYRRQGKPWSRPIAYHWLHYEDPMPVERLAEGVEKLVRAGATFDADAVDKACAQAVDRGFSN
jgi:hypothetical protein